MQWQARRERFRAILSGSGCIRPASTLGAPDLILLTLTELAEQVHRCTRAGAVPLVVDADHGYGNALNVARTIEELATAGVAAATIEDTILPVPFGANGKSGLISPDEGVGKMRAALAARPDRAFAVVGRTSAPAISNIDDTVVRLRAYEQAGVDALFIVGLKSLAELSAVAAATTLPLILGNAAGDIVGADLAVHRVRIALQGHLPIMAAVQAVYETMKALREGTSPAQIKNVASSALMSTLTHAAQYDEATRSYLAK